jgi:hypothetical protein
MPKRKKNKRATTPKASPQDEVDLGVLADDLNGALAEMQWPPPTIAAHLMEGAEKREPGFTEGVKDELRRRRMVPVTTLTRQLNKDGYTPGDPEELEIVMEKDGCYTPEYLSMEMEYERSHRERFSEAHRREESLRQHGRALRMRELDPTLPAVPDLTDNLGVNEAALRQWCIDAQAQAEARALRRTGGVKAASTGFHLAELVGLSFAETRETMRPPYMAGAPGGEKYPKKTGDDEKAQGYIIGEIVKFGGVSEASVRSYAACAALGLVQHICAKTIADGDGDNSMLNVAWVDRHLHRRGSEYGEPKVSEALAQLHREGLTPRLLAYLWENFPDFAEARGLPLAEGEKADAAEPEAETIQTGRLCWPSIIWGGAFVVLEVAFMLGAWLWGQGDNLWQKILASGQYFAGAFGVCVVGFVVHAGKPGRQLLKRCKGEE